MLDDFLKTRFGIQGKQPCGCPVKYQLPPDCKQSRKRLGKANRPLSSTLILSEPVIYSPYPSLIYHFFTIFYHKNT